MALLTLSLQHHHLTSLGHHPPSPFPVRPPPPSHFPARPSSHHLSSLALRNHQRPPALPPFHQLTALSLCHHQLTAARPPTPSTSPTLPRMQPTSPARPPSHQLSLNASNFPLPPLASPPSTPLSVLSTTDAPRLATINFSCHLDSYLVHHQLSPIGHHQLPMFGLAPSTSRSSTIKFPRQSRQRRAKI